MAEPIVPTPTATASPVRAVPLVAQFYPGELRWGDLRALIALASQADEDLVLFEFDQNDPNCINGIYVDIAWSR